MLASLQAMAKGPEAHTAPRPDAVPTPLPHPARIAFVDDEESAHSFARFSFADLAPDWHLESHFRPPLAVQEIVLDPPDAVILDIRRPELSGIDCLRKLKALLPHLPIVMLNASVDTNDVLLSLIGGALGYLVKPVSPGQLVLAVTKALTGEGFLCPWAETQIVRRLQGLGIRPGLRGLLSPREQEVMACLIRGRLDKEIADELGISPRTVEAHLANIFRKLGVHSRHEVVWKFLRLT